MKKITLLLLVISLLCTLCPAALAVVEDPVFTVKIDGSIDSTVKYSGRDTLVLDWQVRANKPDLVLRSAQGLRLVYDNTVLQLLRWNAAGPPTVPTDGQKFMSAVLNASPSPSEILSLVRIYQATKNEIGLGYLSIAPESAGPDDDYECVQGEYFTLTQIRFAFRPDKSVADLTESSVRIMNLDEMVFFEQRTILLINENHGNDISYTYGNQERGVRMPELDNLNEPVITLPLTVKPVLGGTVTITGVPKFEQTLTVNTSGLTSTPLIADLSPLEYQWKRGDTVIGTESTYATVVEDIGKKITVTVSSGKCSGSVTSSEFGPIEKADGPAAPAAPTMAVRTDTTITLATIAGAQYRLGSGAWQDSATFINLLASTPYTFTARIKETATTYASVPGAASAAITTLAPNSVIAAFNYTPETAETSQAAYPSTGGVNTGAKLEFQYSNNYSASIGRTQKDRAAVNCPNSSNTSRRWYPDPVTDTRANKSAGWIITLNTSGYRNILFSAEQASSNNGPGEFKLAYRVGTSGDWTDFGGTEMVSVLSDDKYTGLTFKNVTLPAGLENQPSVQLKVYIASDLVRIGGTGPLAAYNNGNTSINNISFIGEQIPAIPTLGGTVTINGTAKYGQTLTANTSGLTSTPPIADLGLLTYQWKSGETIVGTNSATYAIAQTDIGKTITVTVTAANCTGSVTSAATAAVAKADQAALVITPVTGKVYGNAPFQLATTGGSGTGGVTYALVSGPATVSATGSVTINGAGSIVVTATKAADATYEAVTSAQLTIAVAKAQQAALVITPVTGKVYGDAAFQLATTGGSGSGTVSYALVSGPATVSATGLVTITGAGSIVVTATKASDNNYESATSAQLTIAVAKAQQAALVITPVTGKVYGDAPFQLATTGGSGTGAVTYTLISGPATVTAAGMVTITGAGSIVVTATKAADANYEAITSAQVTIVVTAPATPVITITGQPAANTTVYVSSITGSLNVTATVSPVVSLTYTWYRCLGANPAPATDTNVGSGASFVIPKSLVVGTYYYYCVVSATGAASVTSNVAAVTVEEPEETPVTSVSVLGPGDVPVPAMLMTARNTTIQFSVMFNPGASATVVWTSSDTSVATVSQTGLVTTKSKAGIAVITARDSVSGCSATFIVRVS